MEQIADRLMRCLKLDKESEEQTELYRYGICEALQILINVLTIAVIGYFFGKVGECVIFYLTYTFIRIYAGGYHADKRSSCYVLSSALLLIFLFTVDIVKKYTFWFIIPVVIAAGIIFCFSPVENSNHPLDDKERRCFCYIARGVLILYSLIILVGIFMKWKMMTACLMETLMWAALMLPAGLLKYGRKK